MKPLKKYCFLHHWLPHEANDTKYNRCKIFYQYDITKKGQHFRPFIPNSKENYNEKERIIWAIV